MRPLTPAVLSSLMSLTTPPEKGQVEYENEKVLVKQGPKGAVVAEFALSRLCELINAYVSASDTLIVDPQAAFRDAKPIRGNSNVRSR